MGLHKHFVQNVILIHAREVHHAGTLARLCIMHASWHCVEWSKALDSLVDVLVLPSYKMQLCLYCSRYVHEKSKTRDECSFDQVWQ